MKITEITVTAGRTFNHPHEQYSNLRPEVTLRATLDESDDPVKAAADLQQKAETLVEDHKQGLLSSIESLYELTQQQAEVRRLGDEMKRVQDRLNELRAENPKLLEQTNLPI